VNEEVLTVRIGVEDQRPVTAVRGVVPPGIVLAALLAIVVSISSLIPSLRVRRERDRGSEESNESPV
jgi:hypothetical protein